jgi:hypothetical protein
MDKLNWLLPLVLGATAPAVAQNLRIPQPTSDWGCEVLLCLANPQGPTAVEPCVPPIQRLWRHLARGGSFPGCTMASGPGGRSYAQLGFGYHDPCPTGSSALPVGRTAQLTGPIAVGSVPYIRSGMPSPYAVGDVGATYVGSGEGAGMSRSRTGEPTAPKVCVAGSRGHREIRSGDDVMVVEVYDVIYIASPRPSARYVDVFIDDALWHRVRW